MSECRAYARKYAKDVYHYLKVSKLLVNETFAVKRAKKDKPDSPMVDMILNLLKQTKNCAARTPL